MRDGVTIFTPSAGYVVKFKKVNEERDPSVAPSYVKAFLNVLHSPLVPSAQRRLSPEELVNAARVSASFDDYEIPFVLCNYIAVVADRKCENAMQFDVTVSSTFYEHFLDDDDDGVVYRSLLVDKACAAIKDVHGITIPSHTGVILNRKWMGEKAEDIELVLYKPSGSLVREINKAPKIIEVAEESKPLVTITNDSVGGSESMVKEGDTSVAHPDLYTVPQSKRIRMRIVDGKHLETRIIVDSFEGLHLEMSRDRIHLRNKHQSIADFHICIQVDKWSAKANVIEDGKKKIVQIIAPVKTVYYEGEEEV